MLDNKLYFHRHVDYSHSNKTKQKQSPWPVVRKRTIPTELPPLVGEVSANHATPSIS
jgi:hypothetical protein